MFAIHEMALRALLIKFRGNVREYRIGNNIVKKNEINIYIQAQNKHNLTFNVVYCRPCSSF